MNIANLSKDLLLSGVKGVFKPDAELAKYASFGLGGPADLLVEPDGLVSLAKLVRFIRGRRIPLVVLGAGTNVLIKDNGIRGIVIRLKAPYFCRYKIMNRSVKAAAGLKLNRLLTLCMQKGISGLEFLAGIPGTVGGAVVMNAGISRPRQESVAGCLKKIKVMDCDGKVYVLKRREIQCSYRNSPLAKYIVLEAEFCVRKKTPAEVGNRLNFFLNYRKHTQEFKKLSAGCIFRNPSLELSAGKLIELAGLKNLCCGRASVSRKHANYIIVKKKASSEDVLSLISKIKARVKQKFGIQLQPEVKILGR